MLHFTFVLLSKKSQMKKLPLLPHAFQKIGFILLVPFLALGIASIRLPVYVLGI